MGRPRVTRGTDRHCRHALPSDPSVVRAAHGWDIAGAHAAGLRTAWVARGEGVLARTVPEADVRVPDLAALAEGLLR
jgi:2-haloacid dehalogenase